MGYSFCVRFRYFLLAFPMLALLFATLTFLGVHSPYTVAPLSIVQYIPTGLIAASIPAAPISISAMAGGDSSWAEFIFTGRVVLLGAVFLLAWWGYRLTWQMEERAAPRAAPCARQLATAFEFRQGMTAKGEMELLLRAPWPAPTPYASSAQPGVATRLFYSVNLNCACLVSHVSWRDSRG